MPAHGRPPLESDKKLRQLAMASSESASPSSAPSPSPPMFSAPTTAAPLHHLDTDDSRAQPPQDSTASSPPMTAASSVLPLLYISHTLSTWNSRTFEFGAVLFLAALFPSTLAPASAYALVRAGAAVLLAGKVGAWVDAWDRLKALRWSVVAQRVAVAAGCVVFLGMGRVKRLGAEGEGAGENMDGQADAEWRWWVMAALFAVNAGLACVEKLGIVGNLVAVERDWVIVISEETGAAREDLNAVMRRIDLTSKLLAPVFVSLVDGYSSTAAIWVVFMQNALSVVVEYFTIAQVYHRVPGLRIPKTSPPPEHQSHQSTARSPSSTSSYITTLLHPWRTYTSNTAFLASLSLSLLYLTVLSTGVQMQTYLLTLTYTPLSVSLMRLAAVGTELLATCAAPLLMRRISAVRAGLWFVNEQLLCVAASVALYLGALSWTSPSSSSPSNPNLTVSSQKAAGAALVAGVTLSRLGLWGFDLCVQYLIQTEVPSSSRGAFSSAEMALQNLFELLSFALTVVFPRPEQFVWPVLISAGAVAMAAACFAAFVRMRRGHLLHASRCLKGRERYVVVPQGDAEGEGDGAA